MTGLVDLWRQASLVAGLDLRDVRVAGLVGAVLDDTRYGAVWLARHALLVPLAGLLLLRHGTHAGDDEPGPFHGQALLLAATALALGAAAGHAAASPSALPVGVAAVHLAAAGVWAGALGPLALLLHWTKGLPATTRVAVLASAARRFSGLGIVAVTLLVTSGVAAAWEHTGGVPGLLGTRYGTRLLAKLALLIPLLAVAAVNLLVVRPHLADDGPAAAWWRRRLARLVLVEALLAAVILGVAAGLGLTVPGAHDDVRWPLSFRLAWEAVRDLPGVRPRVALGSQLATLGLVTALLALVARPRRWVPVSVAGFVALAAGAGLAVPPLSVDAYPTTYARPAIPYLAASIAQGRTLYRAHCQACHGVGGQGDGPLAAGLPRRPADLTAGHAADHTAGDLFWWISEGIAASAMPAFRDTLDVEARWDLVNFVRALAAAERARDLGPVATPAAAVVAPDFGYGTGVGPERLLRDLRGRAVVVLVFFSLPGSAGRLARLDRAYPEVRAAGGEILAVPARAGKPVYRALRPVLGRDATYFPVAVDGAGDAVDAYALFRRDLSAEGLLPDPPLPAHMELLVDRQGYLRARWIPLDPPREGAGWADPARLVAEVARLAVEPPRVGAAPEHVH